MSVQQAEAAVKSAVESFAKSAAGEETRKLTKELADAKAAGAPESEVRSISERREAVRADHMANVTALKAARKEARRAANEQAAMEAAAGFAGKTMEELQAMLHDISVNMRTLKGQKRLVRAAMSELNAEDQATDFVASASPAAKREALRRLKEELGE